MLYDFLKDDRKKENSPDKPEEVKIQGQGIPDIPG
jgi:hypothetical protein